MVVCSSYFKNLLIKYLIKYRKVTQFYNIHSHTLCKFFYTALSLILFLLQRVDQLTVEELKNFTLLA
jgi:hypothetical protein